MTTPQIIYNLRTNVPFAVRVVIENNPKSVADNLSQNFGSILSEEENVESIIDFVLEILQSGSKEEKNIIKESLKVEFISDNATPSLNKAHDIIVAKAELIKRNR